VIASVYSTFAVGFLSGHRAPEIVMTLGDEAGRTLCGIGVYTDGRRRTA
jgi:hypothetical protein